MSVTITGALAGLNRKPGSSSVLCISGSGFVANQTAHVSTANGNVTWSGHVASTSDSGDVAILSLTRDSKAASVEQSAQQIPELPTAPQNVSVTVDGTTKPNVPVDIYN